MAIVMQCICNNVTILTFINVLICGLNPTVFCPQNKECITKTENGVENCVGRRREVKSQRKNIFMGQNIYLQITTSFKCVEIWLGSDSSYSMTTQHLKDTWWPYPWCILVNRKKDYKEKTESHTLQCALQTVPSALAFGSKHQLAGDKDYVFPVHCLLHHLCLLCLIFSSQNALLLKLQSSVTAIWNPFCVPQLSLHTGSTNHHLFNVFSWVKYLPS